MYVDLMLDSLEGLSVGDAVGQQFPVMRRSIPELLAGEVPPGPWEWTDDTEMACSVVAELAGHRAIDQDRLAMSFAKRFDPARSYGWGAQHLLRKVRLGHPWRKLSAAAFDHRGSCGNGGAMRVAPLGAYFAGKPERAAAEAILSAQVTHMHSEGVLGAAAVAVAAAIAAQARLRDTRPGPAEFLTAVLEHLDGGETTGLIRHARTLLGAPLDRVVSELGNGSMVTAQNTVPLTLWVAATHLHDYPAAIATCLAADGDIDTTGAITGGIVATYTGTAGIPPGWLAAREPLPDWLTRDPRVRRGGKSGFDRVRQWFSR
ncbi:ADP-ribosylglycohydrolase family protein [Nocardia albiluteola]|nr:ADP-ribosylglycohydrolase family protein [Nocardia albiluteola]